MKKMRTYTGRRRRAQTDYMLRNARDGAIATERLQEMVMSLGEVQLDR